MSSRTFLPDHLEIHSWTDIEPWLENLKNREFNSEQDFSKWMKDLSELEAVISEDLAWRYIKMTIDTRDEERQKSYQTFVSEISPRIAPISDELNKKLVGSPFSKNCVDNAHKIYFRKIQKEIDLFNEKNIPIQTQISTLSKKFGEISGALSVKIDGEQKTLQQASVELRKTDRAHRENVWSQISEERLKVKGDLDQLFSELVELRNQIALNSGYDNYRDFKFDALGRFDYSKEDCFAFHESISTEVIPIAKEIAISRKNRLGYDKLHPWDVSVDPDGNEALIPFDNAEDLIDGSIRIFDKIDSFFGDCLRTMKEGKYLDLDSKKGKSPGGYNYPLYETGIPFIFMNAAGTPRDLVTLMHEGGHAIHSFLTHDLDLTSFKSCPSEVAELASMAMELISMDYWDEFYTDPSDLKRAKKEHLEDIISTLPWIAIIDKFQHWIYENPEHSTEERTKAWRAIEDDLSHDQIDWTAKGEKSLDIAWQKQLHLFEVPFYYIEYGMAQLGAIAIWKNYKKDPKEALNQYKNALSLGYTESIGEIYKAAGIEFNFSKEYIGQLMTFLQSELALLQD